MLFREVEADDREEWLRMRQTIWPQHNKNEHLNEMDGICRDPNCQIFVLERANGKMGGVVEIATRPYAEDCHSSPIGYIEGWYVDEDLRQQGCGSRLIRAAENWARSRGCTEMASD